MGTRPLRGVSRFNKVRAESAWRGFFNLGKFYLLILAGFFIFTGTEVILQGYLLFGDAFESRWGYLFLFLGTVGIIIGIVIFYLFLGYKEPQPLQKLRDIYPTYESIYYSPATIPSDEKVKSAEAKKEELGQTDMGTPVELGYVQQGRGNVAVYSDPVFLGRDPIGAQIGAVSALSPYTPKAGEDQEQLLVLPNPLWLLIAFVVALFAGIMSFYMLSRYGFQIIPFFLVLAGFIMCATLPSLVWLALLSRVTRKNPIQLKSAMLAFSLGMMAIVPALILNTLFGIKMGVVLDPDNVPELYTALVLVAVLAPFNEEFCKALGLFFVKDEIDTPLWGFVFGMTMGLGFALIENINYETVFLFQDFYSLVFGGAKPSFIWGINTFVRSVAGPLVHGVGVGLVGYAVAYGRQRKGIGYIAIPLAYLGAVLLHGAWNGGVTLFAYYNSTLGLLFAIVFIIFEFLLLGTVIYHAWTKKPLRATLAELMGKDKPKQPKPAKG
jgi:RsiW-degrading membrane proteinase PrsW (M82 family)